MSLLFVYSLICLFKVIYVFLFIYIYINNLLLHILYIFIFYIGMSEHFLMLLS
jgi:hypothetical protein